MKQTVDVGTEEIGQVAELLMCLAKAGGHAAHLIGEGETPDERRANDIESLVDRAEQLVGDLFGMDDETIERIREGWS